MVWLLPAALAGLTLLAGPLALHLLTRHRARRLPFPTLRFVPPSNTAAVRLRQPTDVWLLILRLSDRRVARLQRAPSRCSSRPGGSPAGTAVLLARS